MSRSEGPLIRPDTNPGRSLVVRTDPATVTSPASLLMVPASTSDPVAQGTVMEIEGSDEESQVTTVTLINLFPSFPSILPQPGMARATAKVEWGVSGVQAQALVDFQHGMSFSVPASFIRITGINEPLPTDFLGNPVFGRNIRVGAFCTYGSVGRSGPISAKKTAYIDTVIPVGGSQVVPIPPFATNFVFYPQFGGGAPASHVLIVDEMFNVVASSTITGAADLGQFNPIELPGDAYALILFNDNAVASMWGAVIFGISI